MIEGNVDVMLGLDIPQIAKGNLEGTKVAGERWHPQNFLESFRIRAEYRDLTLRPIGHVFLRFSQTSCVPILDNLLLRIPK